MSQRPVYRIGTSGWNYAHWRHRFYPPDLPQERWLEFYAGTFDTVEINNTFYILPQAATFDRWRKLAPPGFLCAIKANRFLTHNKKLKNAAAPLKRFLDRIRRLGDRLGPVLYQLPPRWRKNTERLREFCELLPDDLTHVVEFRSPEWLAGDVFAVLEKHRVCLCIHDLLAPHPRRITGPATYVRFHGAGARYAGGYGREQLREWAGWLREAAAEGRAVYVYFNNDAEGHAVRDALTLRGLLGISGPGNARQG